MAITEAQKAASEKYRLKNWESIKEKVRVKNYNRYHNDPQYRLRKIEREKMYYRQRVERQRQADLAGNQTLQLEAEP